MCHFCDSGESPTKAICAACKAEERMGDSMVELLHYLVDAGWGETDCGLLVCPDCIQKVATWAGLRENAILN